MRVGESSTLTRKKYQRFRNLVDLSQITRQTWISGIFGKKGQGPTVLLVGRKQRALEEWNR